MSSIDNGRNKSKLPSTLIQPTAMGMAVAAAVNCKQPIDIPQYTTLNEKYGILADESIGKKHGKDFVLSYYGIGIGGSRSIGSSGSILEDRKVHQHQPTDQNAFYPIPFLIRLITDDIDPTVRDKYRMRVVRKIGDKIYVMYYLKAINFDQFNPSVKIGERDATNGNESDRPYIYKKEDLSPAPYELVDVNSVPLSNQFAKGTGKMDLTLNTDDLNEIKNVCRVLFGDASKAALNEMYLAYGIESSNDGQIGETGTVKYKELQSAIVSFNLTEAWARDANANTKFPWFFYYGNSTPLLVDMTAAAG